MKTIRLATMKSIQLLKPLGAGRFVTVSGWTRSSIGEEGLVLRINHGITLVEVVIGLSLLATLLTGILVAAGGFHKQQRAAVAKLTAVRELDHLASQFFAQGFPESPAEGDVPSQARWKWHLSHRPSNFAPEKLSIISLAIIDQEPNSRTLASVELLVKNRTDERERQ